MGADLAGTLLRCTSRGGDRNHARGGARFASSRDLGYPLQTHTTSQANNYSPAGTHPDIFARAITASLVSTRRQPAGLYIYSFGNLHPASGRARRIPGCTRASGTGPYGQESMSAVDTTRGRIFILGETTTTTIILTFVDQGFYADHARRPNAASVAGENKEQWSMSCLR